MIDTGSIPKSRKAKRSTLVTGLATYSDLTAHTGTTTNPHATTKVQVGLGNVDNTADAVKPVSTAATLAPIGGYANLLKAFTRGAPQTIATHLATLTGAIVQINAASPPSARQALIADSAGVARFQAIAVSDVTNLTTSLAAKAPLASPALTGAPTTPTAALGTNTNQVTSTAFVLANAGGGAVSSVNTKTAAYTLTTTDSIILADATTAALSCTLPTTVGITGKQCTFKRINGGANSVTVGTTNGQTIETAATKTLGSQFSYLIVVSDGVGWVIVGQGGTIS